MTSMLKRWWLTGRAKRARREYLCYPSRANWYALQAAESQFWAVETKQEVSVVEFILIAALVALVWMVIVVIAAIQGAWEGVVAAFGSLSNQSAEEDHE